jgi:hypothetical protein
VEVQKPAHTLKAVKDPGNIFYLKPKWDRNLPYGIFIQTLPPPTNVSFILIEIDI